MENKSEVVKLLKENFIRDNPFPLPIEVGLPPYSTNLELFHAVIGNRIAETELVVKKIYAPYINTGASTHWRELEKNKKVLKYLFQKSNKVIKEHIASCSRFNEIIKEKTNDLDNVQIQMMITTDEIKEYKNVQAEMEKFVNKYSVYENFLREVTLASSEFKSTWDILNRYETLEFTRRECARLMKEGLKETLQLRKDMSSLVLEKSTRLKELSNKLIAMEDRRKSVKEKLVYWEVQVQKIKRMIDVKEEDRVDLGGACWDLYQEMCKRRGIRATAEVGDIDAQTDFITKTIMFYKEVLTIASTKNSLQAYNKESGSTLE